MIYLMVYLMAYRLYSQQSNNGCLMLEKSRILQLFNPTCCCSPRGLLGSCWSSVCIAVLERGSNSSTRTPQQRRQEHVRESENTQEKASFLFLWAASNKCSPDLVWILPPQIIQSSNSPVCPATCILFGSRRSEADNQPQPPHLGAYTIIW